jgi:DNA-directed RNA polymerase subunit beta'
MWTKMLARKPWRASKKNFRREELELGGDITEADGRYPRTARRTVLGSFEQRQDIHNHFDEELTRLSDQLMQEAQLIQSRVESLIGQNAPSDINFESADTVIAARGEPINNDHITRIKAVVNSYLNEIQDDIDSMRESELQTLNIEAESITSDSESSLEEQQVELDTRLATVRQSAERARAELQDLKVLQFLPESRYRELKSRYGQVFQANMGAEAHGPGQAGQGAVARGRTTRSKQRRKKATKRLRVVEACVRAGNRPGVDDPDRAAGDPA